MRQLDKLVKELCDVIDKYSTLRQCQIAAALEYIRSGVVKEPKKAA